MASQSQSSTTTAPTATVKSPLSDQPPAHVRDLPRAFILEQLRSYYGTTPPDEAVESDYALWRCAETGLEFAWPMLPGNARFYNWISQFESYYPTARWEYQGAQSFIKTANAATGQELKILDVGCGTGDFLRALDFLPAERKYAVDMNEPAITACRALGFHAHCGTLEEVTRRGFVRPGEIPWVTSFHCLEHVADPVGFVRSLVNTAGAGGCVLISTPYSPMSFESEWFDIMNHPPHHLTRWNLTAYKKLAALLGLKLGWLTPSSSPLRRTLDTFRLLHYGPHQRVGKFKFATDLLCHFPKLTSLYSRQTQRSKHDGITADVILVELTVP